MKMKFSKKLSSLILCMVLIAAVALFTTGCGGNKNEDVSSDAGSEVNVESVAEDSNIEAEADAESDAGSDSNAGTEINVFGTGETEFLFTVVDNEGSETQFEIHTDKETVGEALSELGLIDGEQSEYGLYVKTVNGITVDYDKDGKYWAFYIDDEYASSGVDSTTITQGESYSFKVE